MKKAYRLLFSLHLFVGVGAIAGGLAMVLNPQEPLGVSVELLENSPFSSYLIPGIILFMIIGLGNLVSALIFRFHFSFQGYISGVFSVALVIWIIVQCIMIQTIHFLHILFFTIGLIKAILSLIIVIDHDVFPSKLIKKIIKR